MYEYRCRVKRVVDGDTVEVEIDLGFQVGYTTTLRLAGIDAPETRGESRPRGLEATRFLRTLIDESTDGTRQLTMRTVKSISSAADKTEKYGRYLATLLVGDRNLNAEMVENGHAVPYMV